MANVQAKKTVIKKDDFEKAVNTDFETFVDPTVEQDNDTVEELYRLYNKLFYEIPVEGLSNSHEFLVKESSKLYQLATDTDSIQPLLDEITSLREQLLLANEELLEAQEYTEEQNGTN